MVGPPICPLGPEADYNSSDDFKEGEEEEAFEDDPEAWIKGSTNGHDYNMITVYDIWSYDFPALHVLKSSGNVIPKVSGQPGG